MTSRQIYTIYVVVFRTRPDHQWTRHVGLWFRPAASSSSSADDDSHFYFHAVGDGSAGFVYEERSDWNPLNSATFAGQRMIANTGRELASQELRQLMRGVRMTDVDGAFNCQAWVVYALEDLAHEGVLSREEATAGADSMFDLTLEATDDRR